MTIVDAVKEVLKTHPRGLTSNEIYHSITDKNLYSFRAENPAAVVNGTIRRHCLGLDFPSSSPVKYFSIIGSDGTRPRYTTIENAGNNQVKSPKTMSLEVLPEEAIIKAYEAHIEAIEEQLKNAILVNNPGFFEQLIVDLLIAMGYGYDKSSGIVVGGAHDGGIDGIIYEDKLGLDKIYLQAKRYKTNNTVGRKELQAFVGAMQNVQKGVFITTSCFTREATTYAETQQQKNLKLIDGKMLAELMVKHEVGIVRAAKPFVIYKLDNSYFACD